MSKESKYEFKGNIDQLIEAAIAAHKELDALHDVLNQPNLEVIGWHQNGDAEPAVNFFSDNNFNALELLEALNIKEVDDEQGK